jgi:hypothetical protein
MSLKLCNSFWLYPILLIQVYIPERIDNCLIKVFHPIWYDHQRRRYPYLSNGVRSDEIFQWNYHRVSSFPPAISTCWLHKQNSYQSRSRERWAGLVLLSSSQELSFKCCENLVITPAHCWQVQLSAHANGFGFTGDCRVTAVHESPDFRLLLFKQKL